MALHPPRPPFAATLLLAILLAPPVPAGEGDEPAAVRRLLQDPSPSARAAAVRRLAGSESPGALPVLFEALADPHPYVRRATAGVLGGVLGPDLRRRVAEQVPRLRSEAARADACRAFALWADEGGWASLRRAAEDPSPRVRGEACRWLAEDYAPATTDRLVRLLADASPEVRAEAVDALAARPDGPDPLRCLADPDPGVRTAALEAAVLRDGEVAARGVLSGLADDSWSVRALAAESARRTRDRRVLRPLATLLADERRRVGDAAHGALVALTGIPFEPLRERWIAWLEGDGRTFDPAVEEPAAPPLRAEDPSGRTVEGVRFLDLPVRSDFVGFVIDASGSMAEPMPAPRAGTRWDVVRDELRAVLGRLGRGAVNVYCFADAVEQVFPRAAPLTAARRAQVERWLAERRPGGRTALFDGIAAALADPALDTVVVLSDGAPSAGSFFTKTDLLGEVRRLNRRRRARIDVIAVGSDAVADRWRDVLARIASESGGAMVRR